MAARRGWAWPSVVLAMVGCGGDRPDVASGFDLPVVVDQGGPVLSSARVQPLSFSGFPYASEMDTFLQRLPSSGYWSEIGAEYAIGPFTALPGKASDAGLPPEVGPGQATALLADAFDAGLLGAPDGNTIYALFFSSATRVVVGGEVLCGSTGVFGYHAEAVVRGVSVPMIVVSDCGPSDDPDELSGTDALTAALSHELFESATDPFPDSAPAYFDVDDGHAVWSEAIDGGELADLCENERPNLITPPDVGYPVQRVWSNAAATAGTGPCIPVPPGEIYFAAVPRRPASAPDAQVTAAVGSVARVQVDFRQQPGPPQSWQALAFEVQPSDEAPRAGGPPVSGTAGHSATIAVMAPSPRAGTFPLVILSHSPAGAVHLSVAAIVRQ